MSRSYRYFTCDVFTRTRFAGNPLAVLPDARGLTDAEMHAIAREFNYSETTFVLPPADRKHAARVRIFTPGGELPFAGHPTIGTAFVLASSGVLERTATDVVFEEGVGPVPVRIDRDSEGAVVRCTLTAPRLPEQGPPAPPRAALARMLGIGAAQVLDGAECWGCGLPFLVVPLVSVDALGACRLDPGQWRETLAGYATRNVYPVARAGDDRWRVRMFAPDIGVAEDPATGSAAAAFAGWLAKRSATPDGTLRATLYQGTEIGRPSELLLEVDFARGALAAVRVGGAAAMVAQGTLSI